MTTDKLLLNDDKTEFVVIGTKQQLAKVQLNNITIGQFEITLTSFVRNLGVWFDSHYQKFESYCVTNTACQSNGTEKMAARCYKEMYGI